MLDILGTTAATASFALRVKLFAYAEGLSRWVTGRAAGGQGGSQVGSAAGWGWRLGMGMGMGMRKRLRVAEAVF